MTGNDAFFQGFLDDYFAECDEHLTGASRALLALDGSRETPESEQAAVAQLFRFFHSLKGISAMVELRQAEQLAHHLEDYLRAVRSREIGLTPAGVDVLIEGTQRLEQVIAAYRFQRTQPGIEDLAARIATLAPDRGVRTAGIVSGVSGADRPSRNDQQPLVDGHRWRCTFAPTRASIARGVGVDAVRKQLAVIGRIVEAAPHVRDDGAIAFQFVVETEAGADAFAALAASGVLVERVEPQVIPGAASASPAALDPAPALSPSHVVRVDLTRLDGLMRGVGDLVISRARLADSLARMEPRVPPAEWRAVQENAVMIDRQLRTLREGIMRIRLVPIGEIFRRMPFVVRDLARESGKAVTLELQGQSTEIDKYLIERMMDPVLHLVRNAVSHGIETPAERIARGKRPEGVITLTATAAGETVTIEISDDGMGVDADAVAARARAAGLPVPAGTPDPATLLALLCAPGFSTRDDADRASGRGVGMAVVKSIVEQLSGTIALSTERGAGTRFTIELPLTLAITDALIGRVGPDAFAVPQQSVREVIEVAAADVRVLEQNEIIAYRDGSLPIVRLSRLFGIEHTASERFHVFVVGNGAAAIGLAVDRILGQREIVVRPIVDPLVRVEGISGATDLGDGRVVLILDPAALGRLMQQRASRATGHAGDWGRVRA